MLFKLSNSRSGRNTHCGVLEFVADEGKIYLPYWVSGHCTWNLPNHIHVPVHFNTINKLLFSFSYYITQAGKNNGFAILDILGYLENTHKNPKFGRVRQIPIREFPTKFPNWDLSHSPKFGIFVGIL